MKQKLFILTICATLILALSIGVFWYYHPTHFSFNDRFVIGSSAQEIIAKYGDFTRQWHSEKTGELTCGFYLIREDTPELVMSYDNSLWYEIHFEDGIAVSVRLQEGWYGG